MELAWGNFHIVRELEAAPSQIYRYFLTPLALPKILLTILRSSIML